MRKLLMGFVVFASGVYGCSIESDLTPQQFYNQTQYFFVGTVTETKQLSATNTLPLRQETTIKVIDVLKGDVSPFIKIYTADKDGGCGEWDTYFLKGKLYFIGANLKDASRFFGKEYVKFSILRPQRV